MKELRRCGKKGKQGRRKSNEMNCEKDGRKEREDLERKLEMEKIKQKGRRK
jgi:hypothetical protein